MIWRAAATASSLVLLTLSFRAEAQRPADIVHFTGSVTSWKGDTAQVVLNAAIQEGWHIYAISQQPGGPFATTLKVAESQPYVLAGPVSEGKPERKHDDTFQMDVVIFEKTARFQVPIRKIVKTSESSVPVDVRFQTCNESMCLPPTTVHIIAKQ